MALDRSFFCIPRPEQAEARDRVRFITVVVALALVARLVHLGSQSLWVDELLTLIVSTPKPGHPIGTLLLYNIHGPIHALVVYLFRFVSESEFWLRLPSALAGTASVWFLYAWVREWIGERYARVAALLLALSPLHIHYSQELRNYAFVFFFALVANWLFDRLTVGWTRRRAAGYVLCVAAAALSNFVAAFLFAVHTVLWFGRMGVARRSLRRWLLVGAAVLVLISPWVYRVYTFVDVSDLVTPVLPGELDTGDRLRGETTFSVEAVPYAFYTFSVGFTLGPSLRELHEGAGIAAVVSRHGVAVAWVGLLFGALALAGVAGAWRRRLPLFEIALYLLIPLIGTFLLNWQNAKAFNVRYVLLALPAWLTLVAVGIVALPLRARAAAATAVAATIALSLWHYYGDGRYAKADVRGAMRYIAQREGSGACIFAPTVWHVVQHYDPGNTRVHYLFRRPWVSMERVDAQLDDLFAACNAFWYVRAREWVDDPDEYALEAIRARYRELEVKEFDGVTLFHFAAEKEGDAPR